MKVKRTSFSQTVWFWIIFFAAYEYIQGTIYQILEDDNISYGSIILINGEPAYQGVTEETIPIEPSFYLPIFNQPQVFIAVTGIEVKSDLNDSVYWILSCAPINSSNDEYKFVLDKNQIQFFSLTASYLIFEQDINRKVVSGQTNFQQLIDQLQPANNILRISMPFPNKHGYIKFSTVFITGVKLTVIATDLSIQMNAKTELFNDHYDIIFDMFDSNLNYQVVLIYWNALEYYQLSDEIFASGDHVDGPIGNSHSSSETTYNPFGTESYSLLGLFFGIQILFSRSVSAGQQSGLFVQSFMDSSYLGIKGYCNSDTEVLSVGIQTFKILLLTCSSQAYDVVVGDCANSCSDGYYMHQVRLNRKACLQCDTTCKTCSDYGDTNCTSCQLNQFLIEGQCKTNLDFTYCDQSNVCKFCNSQAVNCLRCGPNLIECLLCSPSFYLFEGKCSQTPPGSSTEESILSEETIQTISDQCNNISQATTYASAALTFTSGFLMVSGSPLLSQLLTTQKAFYLLLININPPKFLQQFVSALSDSGILKQFSKFNLISRDQSEQSESNTIGGKFETQKISSDILLNAGGGISAVTILGVMFIIFVVLENSRIHKIGMLIYEKVACGIIVETFQVSVFIFTFSSCLWISNYSSEIDAIQIIVILICLFSVALTLVGQTKLLWKDGVNKLSDKSQSIVKRALVQKLLNECKSENLYSRLYMVVFLTIECIIFPLIIVFASQHAKLASFSMASIQLLETATTILIRPFVKMRETVILVVEQVIFSGILITFAILTLLLEQVDDTSPSYPSSVNTASLIISILIVSAVLLKPFAQFFKILITLKDLIKARAERSSQKTEVNTKNNTADNSSIKLIQVNPFVPKQKIEESMFLDHIKSPNPSSPSPGLRETIELLKNKNSSNSSLNQIIES